MSVASEADKIIKTMTYNMLDKNSYIIIQNTRVRRLKKQFFFSLLSRGLLTTSIWRKVKWKIGILKNEIFYIADTNKGFFGHWELHIGKPLFSGHSSKSLHCSKYPMNNYQSNLFWVSCFRDGVFTMMSSLNIAFYALNK